MTRYDHRQPPASPRYIAAIIAAFLAALCAIISRPAYADDLVGPVIEEPLVSIAEPALILKDRRCLARWRLINIGAQVADIGTTVAGIESGKGTEANPLMRLAFGKHPKWYELVGFKAATFALTEWQAQRALDRGDAKAACRQHKVGAIITAGVAALNLRIVF